LEIVNNKTRVIIRGSQDLPSTNSVEAKTVYDFQDAVNCNIRYGNYIDATKNQLLVKLRIENLPKLKAGEVKFLAKATIDTNGYMHIEFVCINNGISKSAVYNAKELINYQ
jgi:molecular chaperone DnaK (HSP70)